MLIKTHSFSKKKFCTLFKAYDNTKVAICCVKIANRKSYGSKLQNNLELYCTSKVSTECPFELNCSSPQRLTISKTVFFLPLTIKWSGTNQVISGYVHHIEYVPLNAALSQQPMTSRTAACPPASKTSVHNS